MTTHELAHSARALETEIAARTLDGSGPLLPLARSLGQVRRELKRRGAYAMACEELDAVARSIGYGGCFGLRLVGAP